MTHALENTHFARLVKIVVWVQVPLPAYNFKPRKINNPDFTGFLISHFLTFFLMRGRFFPPVRQKDDAKDDATFFGCIFLFIH